ncbi:MAG: hypothetical protein P1U89_20420 [Verrucomicrobiales bacterium]|nr:hypothetical protein [Verrucomicrobiales bacterium]
MMKSYFYSLGTSFLFLLLTVLVTALCEAAEVRNWTTLNGVSFEGKLLSVDPATKVAKIQLKTEQIVDVPLNLLSVPDVIVIESFLKGDEPPQVMETRPDEPVSGNAPAGQPIVREWTNRAGQKFTGRLVSVDKIMRKAEIRKDTGQTFELDYTILIPADVAIIEAFVPPPAGLVLDGNWENAMSKGVKAAEDLDKLLAGANVMPGLDMTGDETMELLQGINYLDDLEKAKELLNSKFGTSKMTSNNIVSTSGFPHDTIYYHEIDGQFSGFNHLILVTDGADQVVAVQLLNNAPRAVWLTGHTNAWSVYNFTQNRRKGNSSYRIAHKVVDLGKVIRIDSELIDSRYKSREWVSLYLPKKFAGIIRHLIAKK